MMQKRKLFRLLIFLLLFFAFWLSTRESLSPDFGWHLRAGEIIVTKGIPATDPFSYTMSHYPFVDHEWLTNAVFYYLYHLIGIEGLVLLFTIIAVVAVCIQLSVEKKQWQLLPLILSSSSLLYFQGIRPQIISWFFVSLLLIILTNEQLWKKSRWFLPLFLLLWVNLHGSFPIAIGLTALAIIARTIHHKKILFVDWFILFLCICATFINPYHQYIWWEIWMQMSDASLRWKIQEWNPTFSMPLFGFVFLLPLSLLLVLRFRKKFTLVELMLYATLLVMGISSGRHVPFWLIYAIPMTTKAYGYLYQEIRANPFNKHQFLIAYKILLYCAGIVLLLQSAFYLYRNMFSYYSQYPEKAVAFLRQHPPRNNLFAEYDWGGYLIWQYSEKKVFIDGRMPSWRTERSVQGDSKNAYDEYLQIMQGKPETETLIRKYHISTIMIKKNDDTELVEFGEKLLSIHLPFPKRKRLMERLEKIGMKVVYEDEQTMIYQLP